MGLAAISMWLGASQRLTKVLAMASRTPLSLLFFPTAGLDPTAKQRGECDVAWWQQEETGGSSWGMLNLTAGEGLATELKPQESFCCLPCI